MSVLVGQISHIIESNHWFGIGQPKPQKQKYVFGKVDEWKRRWLLGVIIKTWGYDLRVEFEV